MMVKSGIEKIILKLYNAPSEFLERLKWPGRLAGISEGARGISKYFFLGHFSLSFLSQKW